MAITCVTKHSPQLSCDLPLRRTRYALRTITRPKDLTTFLLAILPLLCLQFYHFTKTKLEKDTLLCYSPLLDRTSRVYLSYTRRSWSQSDLIDPALL